MQRHPASAREFLNIPPAKSLPDRALVEADRPVNVMLRLQRTAGNAAVGQLLARQQAAAPVATGGGGGPTVVGKAPARKPLTSKTPLADALGFASRMDDPRAWAAPLTSPMVQTLIRLLRGALLAGEVNKNKAAATELAGQALRLTRNVQRTLSQLTSVAPSPWMWQAESLVLGMMLMRVESAANATMGIGSWTLGREENTIAMLQKLDIGLARLLSPAVGRTKIGSRHPGGTVTRKVFLGTAVTPTAVISWFLELSFKFPEKTPTEAGDKVGLLGALSIDSEGKLSGSSVGLKAGGVEGAPSVTGTVKAGEDGVPTPSLSVNTDQGSAEVSAKGVKASVVAKKKDWTETVTASATEIKYSSKHDAGGGVDLSGSMSKLSLAAVAPELHMGAASVTARLITEIEPHSRVFASSQTQSPDTVRAFERACMAMLVITALPITAGALAAGGGAVIAVGESFKFAAGSALAAPLAF